MHILYYYHTIIIQILRLVCIYYTLYYIIAVLYHIILYYTILTILHYTIYHYYCIFIHTGRAEGALPRRRKRCKTRTRRGHSAIIPERRMGRNENNPRAIDR